VSTTLDGSIRAYSRRVTQAVRYTETTEISALLAERERIRDALRRGIVLDDSGQSRLDAADAHLFTLASTIARQFPDFDAESAIHEAIGVPAARTALG
jgi:hypothetical protein